MGEKPQPFQIDRVVGCLWCTVLTATQPFAPSVGHGKNHKDAASVRATHPIPAACGIYYFEVKIVSKGRDGYVFADSTPNVLTSNL